MRLLLFLFLSIGTYAQQSGQTIPSFYGCGISLRGSTSPGPSGFCVLAIPVSSGGQVYSFSEIDYFLVAKSVTTTTLTGIATPTKIPGLFVLGAAGASTGTTATTGAFSGGAAKYFDRSTWQAKYQFLPNLIGFEVLKSAVSGTNYLVKIGWGKTVK